MQVQQHGRHNVSHMIVPYCMGYTNNVCIRNLYSTLTPQQMAPQQISTKLIELFTLTIH